MFLPHSFLWQDRSSWESKYRRRRQWRSSLVTSLRTSVSVYSSSTNWETNQKTSINHQTKTTRHTICLRNRRRCHRCSTLSMVSASAPCSFSQSRSCLSGSWSAGMWKMEGSEMSVKKHCWMRQAWTQHKLTKEPSLRVYLVVCVWLWPAPGHVFSAAVWPSGPADTPSLFAAAPPAACSSSNICYFKKSLRNTTWRVAIS